MSRPYPLATSNTGYLSVFTSLVKVHAVMTRPLAKLESAGTMVCHWLLPSFSSDRRWQLLPWGVLTKLLISTTSCFNHGSLSFWRFGDPLVCVASQHGQCSALWNALA
jgi:hypothetical protein